MWKIRGGSRQPSQQQRDTGAKKGAALAMYGEYQVSDRSRGLISRPGHHQILAHYLARLIVATLEDLYRV